MQDVNQGISYSRRCQRGPEVYRNAVLQRDTAAPIQQSPPDPRLQKSVHSMDPSYLDRWHEVNTGTHLSPSNSQPTPKRVPGRHDNRRRELVPLRFQHAPCRLAPSRRRLASASQIGFTPRTVSFSSSGVREEC